MTILFLSPSNFDTSAREYKRVSHFETRRTRLIISGCTVYDTRPCEADFKVKKYINII